MSKIFLMLLAVMCVCESIPLEKTDIAAAGRSLLHRLHKRFVNPAMTSGAFASNGFTKIRAKRDSEDCEKLELCKLHARSNSNFIAAFELYFVNKENARLWDHHAHSLADCEWRYSCDR